MTRQSHEISGAADHDSAPATGTGKQQTKAQLVERLLKRPRGASVAELAAAMDWQPHTVRAFLSGLRKKGRELLKENRKSGEVSYRLSKVSRVTAEADNAKPK